VNWEWWLAATVLLAAVFAVNLQALHRFAPVLQLRIAEPPDLTTAQPRTVRLA
jgi:hypothetical protein